MRSPRRWMFGAAGLGALHGGDDLRQRGGFPGGGDAHDQAAVQIHRAGINIRPRFFFPPEWIRP